jgi:UDP-glucose:(heptosyl)LPS alpha-1,3-glucosyltransferase
VRGALYRLTGRCRSYLRLERAVFDRSSRTQILVISPRERDVYVRHYETQAERFHALPPGIARDRVAPANAAEVRAELRRELGFGDDRLLLLMVGSGFKTKGVDRAVKAVASLPADLREQTSLVVVGEDHAGPFRRLAGRLGVGDRVVFAGGRSDVPRFLLAADLLIHPAYRENTGTVLVEALAAGLPVLASDVCGYGDHVTQAGGGALIPSPFRQDELDRMLSDMLVSDERAQWQANGKTYVARTDVFSLPEKAADVIEQVASC